MPSRAEVIEQLKPSRKTSGLGLLAKLGGLTNRLGELLGEVDASRSWITRPRSSQGAHPQRFRLEMLGAHALGWSPPSGAIKALSAGEGAS